MALPPQVQAQLDAAEALLAQANAPQETAQQVQQPEPVAEAPEPTPAPQPAPEPNKAPVEPQRSRTAQDDAVWEQRYKSLQGIHNRQVSDFKERMERQEAQIAQLMSKLEAQVQPQRQVEVNSDDAELFGKDLVEMVQRATNGAYERTLQAVESRLTAIEQRLQGASQTVAKTADEAFMDRLLAQVPDFEAVNTSEAFLAWLADIDPVYGVPRQAALTAAGNERDLARVVSIFKAYKATFEEPSASPSASQQLERQVAPRSSGSTAQPQGGQAKLVTTQEINDFYRDIAQGKYRGKEQEQAKREAFYNAALAEGRIVNRLPR